MRVSSFHRTKLASVLEANRNGDAIRSGQCLGMAPETVAAEILSQSLFHVFLDSPRGRESLIQSAYFTETIGCPLVICFSPASQFVMYTGGSVFTLDVAHERVGKSEVAEAHVREILADYHTLTYFYQPTGFTSGVLPNIPNQCPYYAYPTLLNSGAWPIGVAKTALQIRNMARSVRRPVFVPAPAAKQWKRVAAVVDESASSDDVVSQARQIALRARTPLTLFTSSQASGNKCLDENRFSPLSADGSSPSQDAIDKPLPRLQLGRDLYAISSDSLVVLLAGEKSLVWDLLAGGSVRHIQSRLPNPLVVVGPNCHLDLDQQPHQERRGCAQ